MKLRAAIMGDNDSGGVSGVSPWGKRILLMDESSAHLAHLVVVCSCIHASKPLDEPRVRDYLETISP